MPTAITAIDDAIYVAVRLLGILARGGESLAEMRDACRRSSTRRSCASTAAKTRKFAIVEEVSERLRGAGAESPTSTACGCNTADGWWLLRASNTQAVIVARAEAASEPPWPG